MFAAAEDWGSEGIVRRFIPVLGKVPPEAYDTLAHLGTSRQSRHAVITNAILRTGLGDIIFCMIPIGTGRVGGKVERHPVAGGGGWEPQP